MLTAEELTFHRNACCALAVLLDGRIATELEHSGAIRAAERLLDHLDTQPTVPAEFAPLLQHLVTATAPGAFGAQYRTLIARAARLLA
jgi:hypothetical protein